MKSDILGAETSRQESQVLALGQIGRVLVVIGTLLACLPVFNVDLATVVSFCGIGGLAISLLSKGICENLMSSLTIYLTQPFTLGDWIQSDDGEVDGWVQSMGLYHTVVMRWDQRPLYIPNSRLTQVQIINASRMTNRRILMNVRVRIGDLDRIDAILKDIGDLIENHKEIDPEMHRLVRLEEIKAHAAMIWVSCYTKGINLQQWTDVREDVILSIRNIMFKHGTTFATTLERETRRINSGGALLGDSLYDVGSASIVGTSAGLSDPRLAGGDAEVFRKLMANELQRLSQMRETLRVRERDLKDTEGILEQKKPSQVREVEEDDREARFQKNAEAMGGE